LENLTLGAVNDTAEGNLFCNYDICHKEMFHFLYDLMGVQ